MSISILDLLKERRRDAATHTTTDIPVPGYGGALVVRYRLLDPLVEGKEIGERVASQFKGADEHAERMFYSLVDAMIVACVAIFAKVNDALVPLAGEGTSTTFEDTTDLAEMLGFPEPGTTRETVEAVFAGNRIAVSGHAQRLQLWMADVHGDLDAAVGFHA
jgi:hypothetical protein